MCNIELKMSKRSLNTSGGNNTLLNYFARSPSTPKGDKPAAAKIPDSPLSSKSKTPTTSKTGKFHPFHHLTPNRIKILIYLSNWN